VENADPAAAGLARAASAPGGEALAARFDRLDPAQLRRRRGEKWALHPPDVLPAWVAEMDFPLAAPVRRVVEEALALDDLGYPLEVRRDDLPALFAARMAERYGWSPDPGRVELLSDVVQGLYLALDRLSAPGDGVVVQTPVYPPFLAAVRQTGRRQVESPLRRSGEEGGGGWAMELEDLRRVLDPGTRMLLLCNPQNPTGRVFTRAELEALAELALAHDLVVVSDEIHADLIYPGHRHVAFASLGADVEARTVTLSSASKAFNIPGLRCAVAAFGSAALHRRFLTVPRPLRGGLGALGLAATRAAWTEGGPWLEAVRAYLLGNRARVAAFVEAELPGVEHVPPEASYLAWLDCRALGLGPSPQRFFLEHARVALSAGEAFGRPGTGFVRLNFATSRGLLDEILARLAGALRRRG
jgi:cystathionine beta-lyase